MSACCLFLLLAKANTWLNPFDNTILAFGYRFFIFFAPYFLFFSKHKIAAFSFFVALIGIIFWFISINLVGAILFSAGIAVGGYVLKVYVSKTPAGAANNKIALNIGSFFSGVFIYFFVGKDSIFLIISLILIAISFISSLFFKEGTDDEAAQHKPNFSLKGFLSLRGIAWSFIGFGIGIKLMSIVSVLPQYLLKFNSHLPSWYGFALSINAVLIILLQRPIMNFINSWSLKLSMLPLILSMLVVASPSLFFCQTLIGMLIWVLLLTVFECAVSILDTFAYHDHSLLIKEASVGLGCASTILIMRLIHSIYAASIIGGIGLAVVLVGVLILVKVPNRRS